MVQSNTRLDDTVAAVIGLGYVGLPLALAFGRTNLKTYGFDINQQRVAELKQGIDTTEELTREDVLSSKNITFTHNQNDIGKANFIIVAVPTPVNAANQPDLTLVRLASELIGKQLRPGTIVVYESTVYPGVTEDVCGPILEEVSGLTRGKDFFLGYSPERINPGDKEHTLEKIVKVVSGEDKNTLDTIARVYETICLAGVYRASNIKTAEAAKVIENTQRDLNIALVNELALIFHRIGINTNDVLEAAGTKWNFLKFSPGLVGGHCIGVDPYYLVHKAESLGYHPQVIAAGRRVNDYMSEFVAMEMIKSLIEAGKSVQTAKVLVMGLTFKENVKDMRNSKVGDTIRFLQKLGVTVVGYDPLLSKEEIAHEFGIKSIQRLSGNYDGIIIATPHRVFEPLAEQALACCTRPAVLFDIKGKYRQLRNKPRIYYKSL